MFITSAYNQPTFWSNQMKKLAFITRHTPTPAQYKLASEQGFELDFVGDRDAFSFNPEEFQDYDGVVVVHPWMALQATRWVNFIGVFENANRAPEGERPSFEAVALHVMEMPHSIEANLYKEVMGLEALEMAERDLTS
jgi:hypothetical protein